MANKPRQGDDPEDILARAEANRKTDERERERLQRLKEARGGFGPKPLPGDARERFQKSLLRERMRAARAKIDEQLRNAPTVPTAPSPQPKPEPKGVRKYDPYGDTLSQRPWKKLQSEAAAEQLAALAKQGPESALAVLPVAAEALNLDEVQSVEELVGEVRPWIDPLVTDDALARFELFEAEFEAKARELPTPEVVVSDRPVTSDEAITELPTERPVPAPAVPSATSDIPTELPSRLSDSTLNRAEAIRAASATEVNPRAVAGGLSPEETYKAATIEALIMLEDKLRQGTLTPINCVETYLKLLTSALAHLNTEGHIHLPGDFNGSDPVEVIREATRVLKNRGHLRIMN